MAWRPDSFRLFISHVSASHVSASDIVAHLRDRFGIDGFVAHENIEPTADWQEEIETAPNSMDALLALLTPGFSNSLWCNQEVGWALGRQVLATSLRSGEDPKGFVGRFQAISSGDGNALSIADRIFSILINHNETVERLGVVTSLRLRHASSREEIRYYLAPAVRRLTVHTPEILDNLENAFRENNYVQTSHYVGDIRRNLIDRGRLA